MKKENELSCLFGHNNVFNESKKLQNVKNVKLKSADISNFNGLFNLCTVTYQKS